MTLPREIQKNQPVQKRPDPWPFFVLTFGLTWLFWILAALSGIAEPAPPILALHYLGGAMPVVVAIILLYVRHTRAERRDYWQRVVGFRRTGVGWYAVVVLIVPALTGAGILLDVLFGGTGAELEAAARFISQPLAVVPFAVFMLLFGPLPEDDGVPSEWPSRR